MSKSDSSGSEKAVGPSKSARKGEEKKRQKPTAKNRNWGHH